MKRKLILWLSATVCLSGWASHAAAAIADGLVGHWTFNETSGTSARDTSGKGNNGTVGNSLGDAPQWVAGQIGGSLAFRGPDNGGDYVIVAQSPPPTNQFSVSAWVYADPRDNTWPQSAIVQSGGVTTAGPLGLVIRLKNRDQDFGPLGNTTMDASAPVAVNETVGFPTSGWQQVGVVADGATLRLYRNGVEVASGSYRPPLGAPITPELGIGVTLDDGGAPYAGYWQGKIDDVGIWSTALTAAQMAAVFSAGKAGQDLSQADAYLNAPPTITTQPIGISRFVGETASFTVQAAGSALTYQWKLNGTAIAGATNATYAIASIKESDAGDYQVTVTGLGASVSSQTAALAVQKVALATGLVGYWKFDETQGETAADATSNHNLGQLNNYPGDNSQWVAGQIGGALQLGGPDAQHYVLVADFPKPTNTITISLWAWAESRPTWASFVKNWGGAVAGQFHFGLNAGSGQENIYIKQADGKTPNTSDTEVFPLGSWQHVAFACDGSKVRLYRNGTQVAVTDYNGTLVPAAAAALGIGVKLSDDGTMADTGAPGYWHGKLDDVALWNRGLSPGEITAIYTAGLAGKGATAADTSATIAPIISSQPAGGDVFEGDDITLAVLATGTPPLTYQWTKAGQILTGATNANLTVANAKATDAGVYRVEIQNAGGGLTSNPVNLGVLSRPLATLISEWKFEGNVKDTSNHGNDGTASGTVEYVAGVSGQAVRLAPANPIIAQAANDLPFMGTDSWSINLWLKLTEEPKSLAYLAGFGPVADRGAGTARGLLAFTGAKNNNVYFWGSNRDTPGSDLYPTGRWAMITLTHDGANGKTTVYLDGLKIAQNIQTLADIAEGDNQISLAPTSNWTVDVGGDFDEFTLWNGVLNVGQLAQLLSVGAPPAVKLAVSLSGRTVTISWPATAAGFTLESADSLSSGKWTPVTGIQNQSVSANAGGQSVFYRLRK